MSKMAETVTYPFVLINDSYLKEYSPIPKNYNLDEIRPFINPTEKLYIEPILGTALYEHLLQAVNDNNVTPEESTLLLNIYPLEGFAIVYQALPFLAFHISETGITVGHSDNSQGISTGNMTYFNNHLKNMIELMKANLKKFLDDHADLFPDYRPGEEICSCECTPEYEWINDWYNTGIDKYEWRDIYTRCLMKKFKPQTYNQLYSIPKDRISIM